MCTCSVLYPHGPAATEGVMGVRRQARDVPDANHGTALTTISYIQQSVSVYRCKQWTLDNTSYMHHTLLPSENIHHDGDITHFKQNYCFQGWGTNWLKNIMQADQCRIWNSGPQQSTTKAKIRPL